MEYLLLIIVLSIIAIGLFYTKKKVQKRQFNQNSFKNIIQVVDGIQVSMGNNMYLTKVGEEYVLVAIGQNGINMVKLDQKEIVDPKEQFDEMFGEENLTMKSIASKVKGRLSKVEK